MKTSTSEWLRAADDDLVLIDRIVEDERLTHLVAFHSQQCVEKILWKKQSNFATLPELSMTNAYLF